MTWINADGSEIDFRAHDRRVKINVERADALETFHFFQFLIVDLFFPISPQIFSIAER